MTQCLMTKYVEGYIEPLHAAEPENWQQIVRESEKIEFIGILKGHAPYTCLCRVYFEASSYYYMVAHEL